MNGVSNMTYETMHQAENFGHFIELAQKNPALAESEFQKLRLFEQVQAVVDCKFAPEVIKLAKDASTIMPFISPNMANQVIELDGLGDSSLVDCLTPEQWIHMVDRRSWTKNGGLDAAEEMELSEPKTAENQEAAPYRFRPGAALDMIIGLKILGVGYDENRQENIERVELFFEQAGINLLYAMLAPHVEYTGTELGLRLSPGPHNLHILVQQDYLNQDISITDGDVEEFMEILHDDFNHIFRELCEKFCHKETVDIGQLYIEVLERNPNWLPKEDKKDTEAPKEPMHYEKVDLAALKTAAMKSKAKTIEESTLIALESSDLPIED